MGVKVVKRYKKNMGSALNGSWHIVLLSNGVLEMTLDSRPQDLYFSVTSEA